MGTEQTAFPQALQLLEKRLSTFLTELDSLQGPLAGPAKPPELIKFNTGVGRDYGVLGMGQQMRVMCASVAPPAETPRQRCSWLSVTPAGNTIGEAMRVRYQCRRRCRRHGAALAAPPSSIFRTCASMHSQYRRLWHPTTSLARRSATPQPASTWAWWTLATSSTASSTVRHLSSLPELSLRPQTFKKTRAVSNAHATSPQGCTPSYWIAVSWRATRG